MKTLKQIIKEVENYQCTDGNEEDRVVRSQIIKVDLLFDAFQFFDSHIRNFENPNVCFDFFDDLFVVFTALKTSTDIAEKKCKLELNHTSANQYMKLVNFAFKRKELLEKYDGNDKKFIETITKDIDEYVNLTYGRKD